jgi:hypothetical protein
MANNSSKLTQQWMTKSKTVQSSTWETECRHQAPTQLSLLKNGNCLIVCCKDSRSTTVTWMRMNRVRCLANISISESKGLSHSLSRIPISVLKSCPTVQEKSRPHTCTIPNRISVGRVQILGIRDLLRKQELIGLKSWWTSHKTHSWTILRERNSDYYIHLS